MSMQKLCHSVAQAYIGKVTRAIRLVLRGSEMAAKRSPGVNLLPPLAEEGLTKEKNTETILTTRRKSEWCQPTTVYSLKCNLEMLASYIRCRVYLLLCKHACIRIHTNKVKFIEVYPRGQSWAKAEPWSSNFSNVLVKYCQPNLGYFVIHWRRVQSNSDVRKFISKTVEETVEDYLSRSDNWLFNYTKIKRIMSYDSSRLC